MEQLNLFPVPQLHVVDKQPYKPDNPVWFNEMLAKGEIRSWITIYTTHQRDEDGAILGFARSTFVRDNAELACGLQVMADYYRREVAADLLIVEPPKPLVG